MISDQQGTKTARPLITDYWSLITDSWELLVEEAILAGLYAVAVVIWLLEEVFEGHDER